MLLCVTLIHAQLLRFLFFNLWKDEVLLIDTLHFVILWVKWFAQSTTGGFVVMLGHIWFIGFRYCLYLLPPYIDCYFCNLCSALRISFGVSLNTDRLSFRLFFSSYLHFLWSCRKRRGAINAKQLAYLEKYRPKSRLRLKNGHKTGACCVQ